MKKIFPGQNLCSGAFGGNNRPYTKQRARHGSPFLEPPPPPSPGAHAIPPPPCKAIFGPPLGSLKSFRGARGLTLQNSISYERPDSSPRGPDLIFAIGSGPEEGGEGNLPEFCEGIVLSDFRRPAMLLVGLALGAYSEGADTPAFSSQMILFFTRSFVMQNMRGHTAVRTSSNRTSLTRTRHTSALTASSCSVGRRALQVRQHRAERALPWGLNSHERGTEAQAPAPANGLLR